MELRWKEKLVATIDLEDQDFPTFFGRYSLCDTAPDIIQQYVEFSGRTWPQIEEGNFTEEYYAEEEKFIDLIEDSEWCLVDESGKIEPILIPVFCTDNGVNWRLDPDR
ncbi:hypothetical protein BTA51_28675 [Hahella sp. CCB-MM4]|uniref:hypothetical protein n=1 Tax=Hahella sp. (strain CCB-MM4) TaxID=1926491 RepID=UPI000B9C0960|nr:hypothetical protein [Hahella sp. CCB-MM4]OZG69929.1 hypothetical protein BTA51_28675 [Hahella sp. CCB-MM4]